MGRAWRKRLLEIDIELVQAHCKEARAKAAAIGLGAAHAAIGLGAAHAALVDQRAGEDLGIKPGAAHVEPAIDLGAVINLSDDDIADSAASDSDKELREGLQARLGNRSTEGLIWL